MTTTKRHDACRVGSETDHPCPCRAMVEIRGVPFCETCAREQEAYFAVGRLVTQAVPHAQEGRESDRGLVARLVAEAGER
ncbi:MAG: hypothetical protein WKF53_09140 [Rubrobacter sp.]